MEQPMNTKIAQPVNVNETKPEEYSFGEALELLTEGHKVTRLDWDSGHYLTLHENQGQNQVHIFKPDTGKLHPLLVSDGDILADDWVIV